MLLLMLLLMFINLEDNCYYHEKNTYNTKCINPIGIYKIEKVRALKLW